MEEGGERSKRLSFFTYKSSCMEDSMREATWSDGEASVEAVLTAMPPPLPMTLEERWRRMMSAYHTQVGEVAQEATEEEEEEHVCAQVESGYYGREPDLVRMCEKFGWRSLDEEGRLFEKGRYPYKQQKGSRAERRNACMEMEKYLERERLETDRLIRRYWMEGDRC